MSILSKTSVHPTAKILDINELAYVISIDKNPCLVVSSIDQLNEVNYSKALALRGWDMVKENESVVSADSAFVKSFLGSQYLFCKYSTMRRTVCGKTLVLNIDRIPFAPFDII